ncbi:MAG: hypothetical protein PHP79_04095 [Clostridia bacterium]|nr:hypothetical protein [Clostridia bacterium]
MTLVGLLKKRNGSALVTVIMLLAVIVILTSSVSVIFANNLRQTRLQEQKVQAYYLALTGIDMTLSALMLEDGPGNTLLNEFKWNPSQSIEDDLANKQHLNQTDTINLDNGTVTVNIRPINTDNRREVEIHSIGRLSNTEITNSLTLILEADNPQVQRWD